MRCRPRRVCAVLVVTGALLCAGRQVPLRAAFAQQPAEAPAAFSANVSLVSMMVGVVDANDRFVTGLALSDFAVYEDGVAQQLAFCSSGGVPLDLAILIDASSSMQDKRSLVQDAAAGFARTLQARDRGAVVEFNNSARFLSGFTGTVDDLVAAIRQTGAQGRTALYNALYVTLAEFEKLPSAGDEVRRQAIVVLSDGDDTASLVTLDDVVRQARRAGVRIYTVSLISATRAEQIEKQTGARYSSHADQAMAALARDSGARSFFPSKSSDLSAVYTLIARELSNLYVLGYAPSNSSQDGSYRSLRVQVVTRPNAFARTRAGYFAADARGGSITRP